MTTAEYQREYRRRRAALGGRRLTEPVDAAASGSEIPAAPPLPADPAKALAAWSKSRLRIPPGHPKAGEPLELPEFAVRFFREALADGVREAGLFCARKNAKSAVLAVLILGHLADDGPLRRKGWRCGAASLSRDKAAELWQQCVDISEASGLEGIVFRKVPRAIVSSWGKAEFLSADKSAGQASGFDIAIADEIGLFPERGRALVAGLLSSTSARDGRLIAISVIGDSPLSQEMIERADDPATVVQVYQAPRNCDLGDEAAWAAANPALGTVKSRSYMRDMARRAAANPSEQAAFRVFDLNLVGQASREMVVSLDAWQMVSPLTRPERAGPCFVGVDLGGSSSLTAAALFWPQGGRLEIYGAAGDDPNLAERGLADGIGNRYCRMAERGELRTWPGRVTPVGEFLKWIVELLDGQTPAAVAADRYRRSEALDALGAAGVAWPVQWRAQGTGKDGSADVRAFQRAVLSRQLRPGESLLLESAIQSSILRYDQNGNPALDKARQRGRIDALSAAVLAVGLGERAGMARPTTLVHVPTDRDRPINIIGV